MSSSLAAFVASFLLSALLTRLVRGLALRTGAVDHPRIARKVHRTPVPRLGGVAIVLAYFTALAAQLALTGASTAEVPGLAALFGGGLLIAGLGLVDDLRGADARLKFGVQLAAASLACWGGFRIEAIDTLLGPSVALGPLWLPFTLAWIVGVTNALNLIDGLDGLAGGLAVIAAGLFAALSWGTGDALALSSAAALAGSALGFLLFNLHPASIFMGDTGSMFLGFVLATTGLHAAPRGGAAVPLLVPALVLGVPILDTLLAIGRRAARGTPLFRGDRSHLHHLLLDRGLTHPQAVAALQAVALALGVLALVLRSAAPPVVAWLLLGLAGAVGGGLWWLGAVRWRARPGWLAVRRGNLRRRAELRRIERSLRAAVTADQVWGAVQQAAALLGADCAALAWERAEPGHPGFARGYDPRGREPFRVRYALDSEQRGDAFVELGWLDGRTGLDQDTLLAVEELRGHLSAARAAGRPRHSPR